MEGPCNSRCYYIGLDACIYDYYMAKKMLSYRRETALQDASSFKTTAEQSISKSVEFGKKNKGYYGVQGHSRSSRSVPIESLYVTFC